MNIKKTVRVAPGIGFFFLIIMINGCVAGHKPVESSPGKVSSQKIDSPMPSDGVSVSVVPGHLSNQADLSADDELKVFMVSPGDEIEITVYLHDELSRKVKIPPDGRFYFPLVGEIDTAGKHLDDLRNIINRGLSEKRKQLLMPNDKISIRLFQNDELNREIVVPEDGYIFFPLVGEVSTKNRTVREVRKVIVSGLSKYRKKHLVPGDQIAINVYKNDDLNRQLTIPSSGYIFYPLSGKIKAEGKSLEVLRKIITKKLSKYLVNPQVEVNLVASEIPKIVADPQVAVDIVKVASPNRIENPQVSVEISSFGGQKVIVLGEVKNPGVFNSDGNMSILEAITMAGGPTLDAEQENVLLVKAGNKAGKPELIAFNMVDTLEGERPMKNYRLQKGDIVYLPRTIISDVDRFFQHLSTIISPFVSAGTGIYLGQRIEGGNSSSGGNISIQGPR